MDTCAMKDEEHKRQRLYLARQITTHIFELGPKVTWVEGIKDK